MRRNPTLIPPPAAGAHLARTAVAVAGVASAAMGAFHFFLPQLFGWGRFTQSLPVEIRWALSAINAFLSLFLVAGGLASVRDARLMGRCSNGLLWTMLAFWAFNAVYQVLWPFPTPGVRWVLLAFALSVATLYAAGLANLRGSVK
jgi:hypothetical protein